MQIDVLGIGFDNVTLIQAVEKAVSLIGKVGYAVTPNPEMLCKSHKNEEFKNVLLGADIVIADGIGVVKASRKLGRPLPERVPGIEFANALMKELASRGKRLFLLGAKPGVAQRAAERLVLEHPGLVIAGTNDGYFDDGDAAVLEKLKAAAPDVIFVCLGAPRQELWIKSRIADFEGIFMVGLGGSMDHWAGDVKRAPALFRKLGLEWLFRLLSHPSRLGRAVFIPRFLRLVRIQKRMERRNQKYV